MPPVIACNLASYGPFRDRALEHLARIGLSRVEIPCPERRDLQRVQADLRAHGIEVSTVILPCQMDADDVVPRFTHHLETAGALGVSTVFTSAKSGELDLDYVYGRLQSIGDAAEVRGITVALETHPDLVTNAAVALETLAGVAHPHVRINFDTANLYYYNEGIDAVEELKRLAAFVASVHLKDTNGRHGAWHFPALGEGIVDFPAILNVLEEAGFEGPLTLEIEGIKGEALTEDLARSRVERSLRYLRSLGAGRA